MAQLLVQLIVPTFDPEIDCLHLERSSRTSLAIHPVGMQVIWPTDMGFTSLALPSRVFYGIWAVDAMNINA